MNRTCLTFLLLLAAGPLGAAAFDHTYRAYARALGEIVREDGMVDYRKAASPGTGLQRVLDEMAKVTEAEFNLWPRARASAYAINLYNATALLFVATNYPTANVRALGSITESPWKMPLVPLFGRKASLDDLQHELLRRKLGEHRCHFALVFGARGYPPLRPEPYLTEKLDEQLADQTAKFLNDGKNNQIDLRRRVFWLSPIFKWYAPDFTNRTDLVTYVRPHLGTNLAAQVTELLESGPFKVDYNDFDWTLNDQRGR